MDSRAKPWRLWVRELLTLFWKYMQIPLAFTGGKSGSPLKKKKRKQQKPKIQTPNTIVVVVQTKHKNPSLSPSTQFGEALELGA